MSLQSELTNLQWQDVQKRLIEVQKVHQMCVHKEELSELGMCFLFFRAMPGDIGLLTLYVEFMVWINIINNRLPFQLRYYNLL